MAVFDPMLPEHRRLPQGRAEINVGFGHYEDTRATASNYFRLGSQLRRCPGDDGFARGRMVPSSFWRSQR